MSGVNVKRLGELAHAIENNTIPRLTFDMDVVMRKADANGKFSGCILGYVLAMFSEHDIADIPGRMVDKSVIESAEILGIDVRDAYRLFFPPVVIDGDTRINGYDATPKQVAEVIRDFGMTGEVDWRTTLLRNGL